MKLSDAIALGRTLVEQPDESTFCKCAIGAGLAGVGYKFHEDSVGRTEEAALIAMMEWPWLVLEVKNPPAWFHYDERFCLNQDDIDGNQSQWFGIPEKSAINIISVGFYRVMLHAMTMDTLIDFVRSLEPEEPAETPAETETSAEVSA